MKLRIEDLDVWRGLIYVRVVKGRKDRYTMCPTHLLESGVDLRYNQELLGHKSSKTTEICTHVSNKDLSRIQSPLDSLQLKRGEDG